MKKFPFSGILSWLLVLALIFSLPLPAQAEKYMECSHADFRIVLDETGGASITEAWECFFGGDTITRYRRFYSIPDPWEMGMEFRGIRMDGWPMTMLEEPDESRPEGSACVVWEDNTARVEMYPHAKNESHTFEISYYVTNAVALYEDAAEFHWNLTGEEEAFDIDKITGTVEIPYGTRDMGLYFWGHGPAENAYFNALPDEDGMVNRFELYTENVPKDRAVTIRFAMPVELFPECTRINDWEGLQDILDEEHGLADLSGSAGETVPYEAPDEYPEDEYEDSYEEYEDPYEDMSWWQRLLYDAEDLLCLLVGVVFGILGVAAIGIAFVPPISLLIFYNVLKRRGEKKYLPSMYEKHRQKPRNAPQYYRSLPDDMKPAMVYKLMCSYPSTEEGKETMHKGNAFTATALDLVEEGLLKLHRREDGEMAFQAVSGAETAQLTGFEKNVLDLYITAGADRKPMTTQEITTYMRDEYTWCKDHYREFQKLVDQEFEEMHLSTEFPFREWDRKKYVRTGIKWGVPVALGLMLQRSIFSALILGAVSGLINSLVFSRMDALLHPGFRLLTRDGENRYALWKAYGDYLRDFTLFEEREVQEVKIWRKYLVYATALGCSERVVEQLRIRLPQVYNSLLSDMGPAMDSFRYDDIVGSVDSIETENGYTIRSESSSSWSSSDSGGGDWGGFSDSGGSSDSGSSGSDFD